MSNQKNWLAIYTRPRWEKKVARLLSNKNIEIYCPLNKVVKQWSDRKKLVHEPMFPSYVFVYATVNDYLQIKETEGVLNFVYWLGKPAIIKEKEIESLKSFLNDYTNVELEKIDVNVNDEVRIIHGPLISMEGKVIDVEYNHVKIMLPSLGYSLVAKLPKTHIQVKRVSLGNPQKLSNITSI